MAHPRINTETWTWECVGTHQGSAFAGPWQASAYIAEAAQGWYAGAEGHKTGPDYVYRLPGRSAPRGPYTRDGAASLARQMIGLDPDAAVPRPDRLILYQRPGGTGRTEHGAKDVTGGLWTLASGTPAQPCMICGESISTAWVAGQWQYARYFVCPDHIELHPEARPAER